MEGIFLEFAKKLPHTGDDGLIYGLPSVTISLQSGTFMKDFDSTQPIFSTEKNKEASYGTISPQFPANIDNLNKIYKKPKRKEVDLLEEAVSLVEGYAGEIQDFKTSDGYEWKKVYGFKRGGANILVAFPQLDDDRSIALYVSGEASQWTGHVLVAHLSGSLGNLQRTQG